MFHLKKERLSQHLICARHGIRGLVMLVFCALLITCSPRQTDDIISEKTAPQTTPTVLFAGDSIMEGLGPVIAEMLQGRTRLDFVQAGRSSTGLCRPDFYDWPATMRALVASVRPQTVVICIGTNDDQSVNHAGKRYHFNTPGWEQAYAAKVEEIITIIAESGGTSMWVSPPIMGPDTLRPRVAFIKNIIERTCQKNNVPFVDVWPTLADKNGHYQRYGHDTTGRQVTLRTKDGVHVTRDGNVLLARKILPYIETGLTAQK